MNFYIVLERDILGLKKALIQWFYRRSSGLALNLKYVKICSHLGKESIASAEVNGLSHIHDKYQLPDVTEKLK